MRNQIFMTAIMVALLCMPAMAADAPLQHLSNPQKVGQARMTYLLWDVYDVALFAPQGQWNMQAPFMLTLDYLRALDGAAIAERSAEEIRKQGFKDAKKLTAWLAEMKQIFPDVDQGVQLTGLYTPSGPTQFYHNGAKIGVIEDPEFGRKFFDIWLSAKTSEPSLRRKLLGLK